jgi:hypothetical protein
VPQWTGTCSLAGAPLTPALTSVRTVHALFTLLQTIVALLAVAPLGAPDSPVNYSRAAPEKTEGEEFSLYGPWCARPGFSSISFAPLF